MGPKLYGNYSFDNVQLVVAGLWITGFAEGDDAIMIEPNVDVNSNVFGAGGDATNIESTNRGGVMTVKLLQTSPSNAVFSGLLAKQRAGGGADFPVALTDLSNPGELVASAHCTLQRWPSIAYGEGHNSRDWGILMPFIDLALPGQI